MNLTIVCTSIHEYELKTPKGVYPKVMISNGSEVREEVKGE